MDMDAADAWFTCISPGCYKCREEKKDSTKRKSVFDWRKAVCERRLQLYRSANLRCFLPTGRTQNGIAVCAAAAPLAG
jgi:hypothetical protein